MIDQGHVYIKHDPKHKLEKCYAIVNTQTNISETLVML